MVLLRATPYSATGVDVSGHGFFNARTPELNDVVTGYFLVVGTTTLTREWVLLWLGGGIAGLILALALCVLVHWYGKCCSRSISLGNATKASVILLLGFCACSDPRPPHGSLQIAKPIVDLGFVEPSEGDISHVFDIANLTDEPVELTLGPSDCGCVSAFFEDGSRLDAKQHSKVLMRISGHGRHGALVTGTTILAVKNSDQRYSITLKAVLGGLYATSEPYMVRPRKDSAILLASDRETNVSLGAAFRFSSGRNEYKRWPPDLKLNLLTRGRDADFQLLDAKSSADHLLCHPEARRSAIRLSCWDSMGDMFLYLSR